MANQRLPTVAWPRANTPCTTTNSATTGKPRSRHRNTEAKTRAPVTGSIESEITSFQDQNGAKQERLDRILERLTFDRQQLIQRFIIMETALATLAQTQSFLTQFTDSLNNNR